MIGQRELGRPATIYGVRSILAVVVVLLVASGCDSVAPIASPAIPQPGGGDALDATAWATAMCQSVDQLEQAVGDPTTGQRSAAWQDFETALTGADEERLKAAANGVLGHLTEGSRQAALAASFAPGSGAASQLQALHDGLADGVRTLRDGTLEGSVQRVNDGRALIDAAYENHYEQGLGQMTQVPLGDVPLPCAPR